MKDLIPLFVGNDAVGIYIAGYLNADRVSDVERGRSNFIIPVLMRSPAPLGHGPEGSTILQCYHMMLHWRNVTSTRGLDDLHPERRRYYARYLLLEDPDGPKYLGYLHGFHWFAEIHGEKEPDPKG